MKNKIEVVMLPTEDNSYIALAWNKLVCGTPRMFGKTRDYIPQHLYITVSQDVEPIKEGDWYIDMFVTESQRSVQTHTETRHLINHKKDYRFKFCRKIIATTDPKLLKEHDDTVPFPKMRSTGIAELQQQFLKEFVANPDGKWEVEYEEVKDEMDISYFIEIPKLNQDNTVTITSVAEEKMYSGVDLLGNQDGGLDHFLLHSSKFSQEDREVIMDAIYSWIKENL
jgi:hypothetical protein